MPKEFINPTTGSKFDAAGVRGMLTACDDVAQRLTPWEIEFIESLSVNFAAYERISPKQLEILESIYAEKT